MRHFSIKVVLTWKNICWGIYSKIEAFNFGYYGYFLFIYFIINLYLSRI